MPPDEYESPEEFLRLMDAGELDGTLTTELKTLNRKQLEELAQLLADRDTQKREKSGPSFASFLEVCRPAEAPIRST